MGRPDLRGSAGEGVVALAWAERLRAGWARVAAVAIVAAFAVVVAATPARAGDPLLDLIPACHAVTLERGPVGTSVVLTVRVSRVCRPDERVSNLRVKLYSTESRSWTFTGRSCQIRRIPGQCSFTVSAPSRTATLQYRVEISYYAGTRKEKTQRYIDDTKPVSVWFQGSYATISDGTTTAGVYFGGAKNGQLTCTGASPSLYGQHCADDKDGGTSVTLVAVVKGRLPKGDTLWLTYDAPTTNDPTWGKCNKTIEMQSGTCVLAVGAYSSQGYVEAPASVTFPAQPDAHGGEAAAEIVNSLGAVARADLSIQLCQQDGNPPKRVCG